MTNGEFCNREVVIAQEDLSLVELARLMRDYHVGDVVIIRKEEKKTVPVGIVTDRDLVIKVIAKERSPASLSAGEIMSKNLKVVYEDHSLWETIEVMRTNAIRRVPVVNERNELIGILTADDLVEVIQEEIAALVKAVIKEQKREKGEHA